MQTTQQTASPTVQSGFNPIPTRITDLPPLIIDRSEIELKSQVTESLRDLGTNLAGIHRTAAEAYLSQGMQAEALPHLEAAVTFAPTVTEYRNQLGFDRYLLGDDAGAIEAFEVVLSTEPNQPDALFNLGMVLFGQEKATEAEECFRRSLEINSDDAQAWNNRGVCLQRMGQVTEAKACFDRALQVDPEDSDAKFNLAQG